LDAKENAMEGFDKEVCRRLPLAEAALRMLDYVCREEFLERVFARHRGRSYEDVLKFATLVRLISDALLEYEGSGRQAFERARGTGELETGSRAPYGKLARVPLSLSLGLLAETVNRLNELYPHAVADKAAPRSLRKMEVVYHDGKTIKHVAKRLKVLRQYLGKVLGGKLVVSQSLRTGMAVCMVADEDGESGESKLVPGAVAQVRSCLAGPILHVGDRGFCDLKQAGVFAEGDDHFLLRWNQKLHFHRDTRRPIVTGFDAAGRMYKEDYGWIGQPNDPRRRYVRRIRLKRGAGEEEIILLTDLVDAESYPASDLLQVYLERWGIERMFQQVTEVFHLKSLIGSSPRATVFQASFCFLLYNVIQVMRAYIAEGQHMAPKEISTENLFEDVHRQLTAWTEMLSDKATAALLSTTWTASQVVRRLQSLLHRQWSELWRKTKNKKPPPPHPKKKYPKGGHTSVYRVIRDARCAAGKA
jgi:IS4 transposase